MQQEDQGHKSSISAIKEDELDKRLKDNNLFRSGPKESITKNFLSQIYPPRIIF